MRLNFATNPPDVIEEGIRRLSQAVERCLATQGTEEVLPLRQREIVV